MAETKSDIETLLIELANDYSTFANINVSEEKKVLEESLDELLQRLEEFCGLIEMTRNENAIFVSSILPEIYRQSDTLEHIYKKIDKLQLVVDRVGGDVLAMEHKLDEAERLLGDNPVKKLLLSSLPRPSLFSSKKSTTERKKHKYEAPPIFRTEELIASSVCQSASSQ